MVLTTQNSGKYLSKKWHEMREKALTKGREGFTDEELEYLEVPDAPTVSPNDPEVFMIETDPVDPGDGQVKKVDIRERPGKGGLL